MDRGADSTTLAEINADQCAPVHLLEIHWDEEVSYLSDFNRTITYNSNNYVGLGHMLGFSDVEETSALVTGTLSFSLSGVDKTYLSFFLSRNYIDREVRLYKTFLDSALSLIGTPILIFSGRIHKPVIQENPSDGTCTLAIESASHWVDFERRSGRHTNFLEQQVYFPDDKGFEFASEVMKDIKWGAD